jgi:regulator of protease activity HflC (stomatin/prohibitin superfamily)
MSTVRIADHEVGLVLRDQRLERILEPGAHRVPRGFWHADRVRVEIIDRLQTRFAHDRLDALLAHGPLRELLDVVTVGPHQRALVWVDGQFLTLLPPGRHAFWKAPRDVQVQLMNTIEVVFLHQARDRLLEQPEVREAVEVVDLKEDERALVWRQGRFVMTLRPGRNVIWRQDPPLTIERVNVAEHPFEHARLTALMAHASVRHMLEVADVGPAQRALVWINQQFHALLMPGRHTFWSVLSDVQVDYVDATKPVFAHAMADTLLEQPEFCAAVDVVELADDERALVWREEQLEAVLGPGRNLLWKQDPPLTIERFDIARRRLEHPRLEAVLAYPHRGKFLEQVEVSPYERCLLIDGRQIVTVLEPGNYLFWRPAGGLEAVVIDLREQILEVAAQEIMTQDKVTLRVTMLVTFCVDDVVKVGTVVQKYAETLYREAQLALRAAVGTRSVDGLLADKAAVGAEVHEALRDRAAEFGVAVRSVGVRDISLPGDMKEILNQVITAEKRAQANVIKRREETAAARSQANTARLLVDNPILARMKELEMLQEVLAGMRATIVLGPGDIARQVRSLVATEDKSE